MNHRLLSDTLTQQSNRSFENQAWPCAIQNSNTLSRSIPEELKGLPDYWRKQQARFPNEVGNTWLTLPKRLVPKRTTNMLNLSKEDGVCKYIIRREVKSGKENPKPYTRALKIQRLLTPIHLQRGGYLRSFKRRKVEHQKEHEYK
ncbi:hypothetical protein EDD85DRAFT_791997 [Armillaria nabsnona]|nr:hypothetical protein EDD85DRAFT_791997 [Armillaria nabsnona]